MKILVTGAAGFLGSEVVRRAIAQGHTVRALARRHFDAAELGIHGIEIFLADIGSDSPLSEAAAGMEAVIHCAAVTSAGRVDRELSRRVNVEGTRRLLQASTQAGVQRWIQISSMSAHAGSTSVYGTTKLAADEVIRASAPPPEWTILRPSLIYGPGTQGLVTKTLNLARKLPVLPLIGSGKELLRPVHVTDVANAALTCLQTDVAKRKTYIIGGADEVSLDTFMRRLLSAADLKKPVVHLPIWLCMAMARNMGTVLKNAPITVDNVLGVREVQPTDHREAQRDWDWRPMGLDEGLRQTFGQATHKIGEK